MMARIVVGVDGSEHARAALRWAAAEARVRGAKLDVVYAYDYEPAYELYEYSAGLYREEVRDAVDRPEARRHAQTLVEAMVEQVDGHGDLDVEPIAVEDRRPARALVRHAQHADLLVVGSRGRGGFGGLLLGSVSQQCVHHATCPVVVVPSAPRDDHEHR